MEILHDLRRSIANGSALARLIYINAGVFLSVKIIVAVFYLTGNYPDFSDWFSVPSSLSGLMSKPWTLLTYMFYHKNFIHLLFNLLGLYWFGQFFMNYFEGRKLVTVYLMGGIAGALLYVAAYQFVPSLKEYNSILMGASAAIFAVIVAVAVYYPNLEIQLFLVGRFKLKYLAIAYLLISFISISVSNPGGNISHLGGAIGGWFYIFNLKRGRDIGYRTSRLIESVFEKLSGKNKLKVTYKQPPTDDYSYNRMKNKEQDEVNRILEKIKASGYESLSKSERETLFRQK